MFRRLGARALGPFLLEPTLLMDYGGIRSREVRSAVAGETLSRALNKDEKVGSEHMEEMLAVFVASKSMGQVSSLLNHLRVEREEELGPRHYNALVRLFTFTRETEKLDQLLEVMTQRNTFDVETVSCIMNALHSSNAPETLDHMLQTCRDFDDHLAYPVEAHLKSLERCSKRPLPMWVQTTDDGRPNEDLPKESIILSSLIHHVAAMHSANAAILVCIWIKAIGCELAGWDYAHVLAALVRDVGTFDSTRRLFSFFQGCEPGSVSLDQLGRKVASIKGDPALGSILDAMMDSLRLRGLLHPVSEAEGANTTASTPKKSPAADDGEHKEIDEKGEVAGEDVEDDAPGPGGLREDLIVHLGWLNMRALSVDLVITNIFEEVNRHPYLGARGENIAELHHYFIYVMAHCRHQSVALDWIPQMTRLMREWKEKFGPQWEAEPEEHLKLDMSDPQRLKSFSAGWHITEVPAHGFDISARLVRDVGILLPAASRHVRRSISDTFGELVDLARPRTPFSSLTEVAANGYVLIDTDEDAEAAWDQILGLMKQYSRNLPRSVRSAIRSYLHLCSLYPPENPKYSAKDLKDRRKWCQYSEARDIALQLYKDTPEGREVMKELYYNGNKLKPRRDATVVAEDVADFAKVLKVDLTEDQDTWFNEIPAFPYPSTSGVPEHLWKPDVYNAYPHKNLLLDSSSTKLFSEDPFLRAWNVLKDPKHSWIYEDHEMCVILLRCFIYRLRWSEAAEYALKYTEKAKFSFFMDAELSKCFEDMGDSSGALHFKLLAGIFDGRIGKDKNAMVQHHMRTNKANPLKHAGKYQRPSDDKRQRNSE